MSRMANLSLPTGYRVNAGLLHRKAPYRTPAYRFDAALRAGTFVGDVMALARVSFGIDMGRNVAMKLVTRSEAPDVSAAIHQIIQS